MLTPEKGGDVVSIPFQHTSSTAQGGGGSFKKRQPIGEVGCCESRMAQSESTGGPTGGWTCVFGMVAMVAVVTLPQLLDVAWCSAVTVVAVVVMKWSCGCDVV